MAAPTPFDSEDLSQTYYGELVGGYTGKSTETNQDASVTYYGEIVMGNDWAVSGSAANTQFLAMMMQWGMN